MFQCIETVAIIEMWEKHAISCNKFRFGEICKKSAMMVANPSMEHWFIHVSWWCWISQINDSDRVSSTTQKKENSSNSMEKEITFSLRVGIVRQMRKCILKHYRELNANDLRRKYEECTSSRRKILLLSSTTTHRSSLAAILTLFIL